MHFYGKSEEYGWSSFTNLCVASKQIGKKCIVCCQMSPPPPPPSSILQTRALSIWMTTCKAPYIGWFMNNFLATYHIGRRDGGEKKFLGSQRAFYKTLWIRIWPYFVIIYTFFVVWKFKSGLKKLSDWISPDF